MNSTAFRIAFGAFASLTVLSGTSAWATATAPSAATAVTVTVNKTSANQVDGGFAGFSYEKDRIGAGVFDPNDTNLVNLFRRLGPSVLRVGGNLVDQVNWNAGGSGGSASTIAPADVRQFAAFLRATGWSAIYGINLKTNTAANAASEAQFVAQTLGSSLVAFEIGNEPNAYQSESAYESSYNSYAAAIRAKVPGAVFDGPGESNSTGWVGTFAAHEKNNHLQILSQHRYIGGNTGATIAGMLASTASGGIPAVESALQTAQSANGIPQWRMTEANSYFHGGAAGVSDVEAASLWSLAFMAGIAAHHGSGVNFHGGTSTQFPLHYTPITFSGVQPTGVQGVYYGELLWSLAGTGPFHTASVSGDSSVTAWGIGNNVFIDNEGGSAVSATVTLTATANSAHVYVLTAPSPASTSITIAGSAVTVNGAFNPAPQSVSVSGGRVTVSVPSDSAALVVTG